MLKKTIFIILFLLIITTKTSEAAEYTAIAEVLDIQDEYENGKVSSQYIRAKILIGPYTDKIIDLEHHRLEYTIHSYYINEDSKILVKVYEEDNNLKGRLISIWRVDYLKQLGIIFLIFIAIFGRLKGIFSVISLIFSGFIIIKFLIPLILKGYDAVWVSVLCASAIIIGSFILISGFTKKSLVAIIGTIGGTVSAGFLSHIYTNLCSITGLASEDVYILVTSLGIDINFTGLYMSAVLVGTIGVVMDVSMSITSVIFEIKNKSPNISRLELMQSGLKVGKDVMSTMVNTLILAYVGSFMPLLVIYITSGTPFLLALNSETLAVEIIRSLCGSIGLIITIPLTCFIATSMAKTKKKRVYR